MSSSIGSQPLRMRWGPLWIREGMGWQKPDGFNPPLSYWYDDDDDERGVLAADRIQYYAESLGMIYPFHEKNLKPASYSLTLGPEYQLNGRMYQLTQENPTLII